MATKGPSKTTVIDFGAVQNFSRMSFDLLSVETEAISVMSRVVCTANTWPQGEPSTGHIRRESCPRLGSGHNGLQPVQNWGRYEGGHCCYNRVGPDWCDRITGCERRLHHLVLHGARSRYSARSGKLICRSRSRSWTPGPVPELGSKCRRDCPGSPLQRQRKSLIHLNTITADRSSRETSIGTFARDIEPNPAEHTRTGD